ncbi:hypothetical protein PIB30_053008 [Stylosanthes scabra]|uniref:Uncharacterized protein n=1 Tax=Stylosanthes scabra TaxID=79078 RepID=A0ABU6ZH71_9FABA|nr:hypothetical protein [Stylosanthes scabra]
MEGLLMGFQQTAITLFFLLLAFLPFYSSIYIYHIQNQDLLQGSVEILCLEKDVLEAIHSDLVASPGGSGSMGAKWVATGQEGSFLAPIRGVNKEQILSVTEISRKVSYRTKELTCLNVCG